MSGRHAAPGGAEVRWWVSHYDRRAHAYRTCGEIYAEAICTHTAITRKLTEDDGTARRCMACLLIVGDELAGRHGERDRWAP